MAVIAPRVRAREGVWVGVRLINSPGHVVGGSDNDARATFLNRVFFYLLYMGL
jgi:hypothetical protein